MRHLSFFIILCLSVTACTDNAYDLSKLDTDENSGVVIGNDNSEFRMPLAAISFTVESFIMTGQKEEVSIDEFMKKVDIWRPSNLPDNRDFIELGRLMEDSDYMNSIITALVDEMNSNQQKREEVCNLIAKDYRGDLLDLLEGKIPDQILSPIYNLTDEEAGNILATLYVTFNDAVRQAVKSLASDFLSGLEIDNLEFFIPSLGVSDDIYSMLVENIDPKEVENPVNALYLYGSIESQVPVTFSVRPYLEGLATRFGDINIAEGVTPINDIRFNADDLYTLMLGYGSRLVLPVDLDRYYVNKKLTKTQEICINLKLRKTGGLKL